MSENVKFHIITLGCRTNQYESRSLRESRLALGDSETDRPAEADLIVVNSCAVTAKAVRDTTQAARKALREAPNARMIVTGCAATAFAEHLAEAAPGAELVPQSHKASLAKLPEPPRGEQGFPAFRISGSDRSRPVIKVQDGCSHRCTFCIVPSTRGPSRSREPREVLAEARRLAGAGFAEIQLSGINLRHYGRSLEEPTDFWDLLAAVEKELTSAPGPAPRIRLSSLDPGQLGNKALETLGASKLVCPHLHLSLQSMSDKVLRNMNRGHYTAESVFGFLDRLAGQWPVFGLGCDMMAGFPGESREDFRMSLEALERLPLSYAHVFPFSPRPGTAAAELPGRPPADEAGSRAAELRRAASRKRMQFLRRLGRLEILRLVLEDPESGEGVCEYYARCRYGHPPPQAAPGGLVAVRPTGIEKDVLLVEDLEETTEVDVS